MSESELESVGIGDMVDRALAASGQVIWRICTGGTILDCRGAVTDVLGAPADHFIGRTVADIVAPFDRDRTMLAIGGIAETGEPERNFDLTLVKPGGGMVEVRAGGVLARTAKGDEDVIIAVTADVSAEMVVRRKLELEQRRFFEVFRDAPVGILLVHLDPDRGAFVWRANDEACRIADAPSEVLEDSWLRKSGRLQITGKESMDAHDWIKDLLDGKSRKFSLDRTAFSTDGKKRVVRAHVARLDTSTWHGVKSRHAVNATIHIEDVTAYAETKERLEYLASHDPLTGLVNRQCFVEKLNDYLDGRRHTDGRGALFSMDLDRFKEVNDTWGHHAGDRVLSAVAGLLKANLREGDCVARIGGDEFAILLPGVDAEDADAIARKLIESLNGESLPVDGQKGATFSPRASIGVLVLGPGIKGADQALRICDQLMYEAKGSGGARHVLHTSVDPPV